MRDRFPSRRDVLLLAAALPTLGEASLAQSGVSPTPPPIQTLRATRTSRKILGSEGPDTDVWQFLGEDSQFVLRAKQGQPFSLRVVNELDRELWLHFHGVRGPAESMTFLVPAGTPNETLVTFSPPDAGTFLLAPLLDASRLRDMGLSAVFIVEEASPAGALVDIPVVLDDWMISEDGKLDQNFGDLNAAIAEGRMGNWFTINGGFKPRIAIDRGKNNRLRLVNVANTRTFTLQFKNTDLSLLALDGQPVPVKPLPPGSLQLAPGQRMDLLMVNPLDQAILSIDLFEDVVEAAFFVGDGEASTTLPDSLSLPPNPLAVAGDMSAARTFPMLLAGGAKGGLKSARVGEEELDLRAMLERGLAWAINGISGPGGPMLFEARTGDTVILAVDNQTAFPQPLHIHGHVWKLIEADGQIVDDGSWRDTAVISGLSQAKLLLVTDNPGQWAIHSLIAERLDAGLFGGFTVSDMP